MCLCVFLLVLFVVGLWLVVFVCFFFWGVEFFFFFLSLFVLRFRSFVFSVLFVYCLLSWGFLFYFFLVWGFLLVLVFCFYFLSFWCVVGFVGVWGWVVVGWYGVLFCLLLLLGLICLCLVVVSFVSILFFSGGLCGLCFFVFVLGLVL